MTQSQKRVTNFKTTHVINSKIDNQLQNLIFSPNNVIKYRNRRSPRNNSIGWGPRLIKRRLLIQILPPLLRGYVKKKKKNTKT